jgi:DNA-directed RNA polymerase subunit E'/Rpb7
MEQIAIFEEKVAISPADLRPEITNFDDILLGKVKKLLEGKCSKHGYVIPDSLELLSRSMGTAEKGRFTSDFLYYLKVLGKVYNPPDGLQVEGEVIRKNKMGLYVIIKDAIRIMVPRDLHIGNEEFDSIEIGDKIMIEIKESRFQVNDTHILSIGEFVSMVSGALGAAQDVEGAEEATEEKVSLKEEEAAEEAAEEEVSLKEEEAAEEAAEEEEDAEDDGKTEEAAE